MAIILMFIVLGLILGIAIEYLTSNDFDCITILSGLLGGLLGILIGLLSILFVSAYATDNCETEIIETEEIEIYALADNPRYSNVMSGVFIVQSITNEKLKYGYMYKIEGKGYSFSEVSADRSYLNYTNEQPKVIINTYDYSNELLRKLGIFLINGNTEYIFYIPEGSQVIDNYVIDFN